MEEAIQDIKGVSRKFCGGETPTWREMEEHGEHHPETYTIRNDCKWNDLVEEALGDYNRPGVKEGNYNYTKEELLSEIKRLSEECHDGDTPTISTLTEHGQYSEGAYRNHFGSWTESVKQAGFQPKVNFFSTDNPKQELLSEIKRVSEEELNGERPGQRDMINYGRCPLSFHKYFGSWNNAVEEAGFERYEIDATGEDHWSWKGGYVGHYGPSWHRRRKEVRQRDGDVCRVCDTPQHKTLGSLEVHHISPCRYWNVDEEHEQMNHPRNLISLCISCHRELDGMFKGRDHEDFEELARDYMGVGDSLKRSIFEY